MHRNGIIAREMYRKYRTSAIIHIIFLVPDEEEETEKSSDEKSSDDQFEKGDLEGNFHEFVLRVSVSNGQCSLHGKLLL